MRLVHNTPSPDTDNLIALPHAATASTDYPVYELVRAACSVCGTHSNALRGAHVSGSCHNCGGYELVVIEGAAPLTDPAIPAPATPYPPLAAA